MKPSIPFLRKVAAFEVYQYRGYTMRRGGYTAFRGGEATFRKHEIAGYVRMTGVADLGRRALAELTEKGQQALAEADAKAGAS